MIDYEESLISVDSSLGEAIRAIDVSVGKIALVVDDARRLVGTVTDGDVRRALLRGKTITEALGDVVNRRPHVATAKEDSTAILAFMRRNGLRHVPLVDADGTLVGLESLTNLVKLTTLDNWVVLMAGGEGQRLRPLTAEVPKPLLAVGSQPILETILDSFIQQGFSRFFISVNYLAARVEEYFGDGRSRGVEIEYLREQEPLGTAGAISLLSEQPEQPILVMNGDILTNVDFRLMLDFHVEHEADATMGIREHLSQIPYGVVQLEGDRLLHVEEKPTLAHFVNAGIYVLSPLALAHIGAKTPMTMPDLFKNIMESGGDCCAFPIRDYWIDIGHPEDLKRANREYHDVFR